MAIPVTRVEVHQSLDESFEDSFEDEEDSDDSNDHQAVKSEIDSTSEEFLEDYDTDPVIRPASNQSCAWSEVTNFIPRRTVSKNRLCKVVADLSRNSSILDIFMKQFPYSLFIHTADCTNERLAMYEKERNVQVCPTNPHEIMQLVGSIFVMCINRLPAINCYWSSRPAIGNTLIKSTFARDRFKLILSKLYFNHPEKPASSGKLYYVEELISCIKSAFQKCRQDSPFQSIDESMTKFKGRSSPKQHLMKSVNRGIKLWMRCDSLTGYTYDLNVYAGKEEEISCEGTLGERVVRKLASSIKENDVTLAFDSYFTTVNLMDTLDFPAVGIYHNRTKYVPIMINRLQKGEVEYKCNENGTLAIRWLDTKEVTLLSNCHKDSTVELEKKQRDGKKIKIECPEGIKFYRETMGGVDLADQMAGLYDLDRKSIKWWRKIFYRSLMFCAVNSWVIYKELQPNSRKLFLDFLCELAESLIAKGKEKNPVKRRTIRSARRIKWLCRMSNVGLHLPVEGQTRRRCTGCAQKGKETRTKTMCKECNVAYCKQCFTPCHM